MSVKHVLTHLTSTRWKQYNRLNQNQWAKAMRNIYLLCPLMLSLALSSCSNSSDKTKAELIGFWQSTNTKNSASIEFTIEGYAILGGDAAELFESKVMKMVREFKMNLPEKTLNYKIADKEHIQIEGDFSQLREKLSAGGTIPANDKDGYDFFPVENLLFTVKSGELTLISSAGKSIMFRKSE